MANKKGQFVLEQRDDGNFSVCVYAQDDYHVTYQVMSLNFATIATKMNINVRRFGESLVKLMNDHAEDGYAE